MYRDIDALPTGVLMPAVAVAEAWLRYTEQDGLQASGVTINPTTPTSRITGVLRLHHTALQYRTNSILGTHSITMMVITDSRVVLSFNPRRTLMLAAVANRSTRHHKTLHQARDMPMMDTSDDLKPAKEMRAGD
jgi:hypothetical protein